MSPLIPALVDFQGVGAVGGGGEFEAAIARPVSGEEAEGELVGARGLVLLEGCDELVDGGKAAERSLRISARAALAFGMPDALFGAAAWCGLRLLAWNPEMLTRFIGGASEAFQDQRRA